MKKRKIEGEPTDLNIILKGVENIANAVAAIKEDPEIIKALSESEKHKLDALNSIANNDKLSEKAREEAAQKIFETIDIGNQSSKDVNERLNNNNITLSTVLISVSIIGVGCLTYKFYGSTPTYEKYIKIASISKKIGKDISGLLG